MKRLTLLLCLLLVSAAMLLGCQSSQPAATQTPTAEPLYPVTITDSLGREVTLESEPQVIVSLTPTNTEILFALGAGDKVAGVDAYSNYPAETAGLPKVGDFSGPSTEAIVALKPDLILASNTLQGDAIDQLTGLGLTVAAIEATTWEQIPECISKVGALLGLPNEADTLNESMAADQKAIEDAVSGAQPVSAYYVISYGEYGNWTVGPGTFIDTMITMAGGESITHDAPAQWLEYNMEDIVAKNPRVFLLSSDVCDVETFSQAEGFKELDAVKENRSYVINADLASRPGPRIMEALLEIAKALHPECFE